MALFGSVVGAHRCMGAKRVEGMVVKELEGARWECPKCGSWKVRFVDSFSPEPGGRFVCLDCGHRWSEG